MIIVQFSDPLFKFKNVLFFVIDVYLNPLWKIWVLLELFVCYSMARIVSFCIIAEFFKDNMKQLQRGENSYNSGHVKSLIFDSKVSPALLKGRVQASMKNKTYQVDVCNLKTSCYFFFSLICFI